jgi:hypothetical protein
MNVALPVSNYIIMVKSTDVDITLPAMRQHLPVASYKIFNSINPTILKTSHRDTLQINAGSCYPSVMLNPGEIVICTQQWGCKGVTGIWIIERGSCIQQTPPQDNATSLKIQVPVSNDKIVVQEPAEDNDSPITLEASDSFFTNNPPPTKKGWIY